MSMVFIISTYFVVRNVEMAVWLQKPKTVMIMYLWQMQINYVM